MSFGIFDAWTRCFDCFFEDVNCCFHLQLGTVHVADQLRRVLMRFQLRHQQPWNFSIRPRRELLKFARSVSSCFALSCSAFSTLSSSLLVFASCSAFTSEVDEHACSFFVAVAISSKSLRLSLLTSSMSVCHFIDAGSGVATLCQDAGTQYSVRSGSRLRVKLHSLVCILFDSRRALAFCGTHFLVHFPRLQWKTSFMCCVLSDFSRMLFVDFRTPLLRIWGRMKFSKLADRAAPLAPSFAFSDMPAR